MEDNQGNRAEQVSPTITKTFIQVGEFNSHKCEGGNKETNKKEKS